MPDTRSVQNPKGYIAAFRVVNTVFITHYGLGGLGIGSLITTMLKESFETKKLRFKEKREAYSGYLEAFQKSVVKSSEENRQNVVYWHKRIELVVP